VTELGGQLYTRHAVEEGIMSAVYAAVYGFLSFFYKVHSDAKRERRNREILTKMLSHPSYKWRRIRTLARSIAESKERTEQILLDMGARPDEAGKPIWTLVGV
jgi:hypothetical protein